jgi:protoporphyrinogen oxidase
MNLFRLPPEVRDECVQGAIEAHARDRDSEPQSFADWILLSLGEGIARHFMFPYNEKLWTLHPRDLTTAWLGDFVPRPDLEAILEGASADRNVLPVGYNAEFYYPRNGGMAELPKTLAAKLRNLRLSAPVDRIDLRSRKVWVGDKGYEYRYLISSVPLTALVGMMEGVPRDVSRAAGRLRCNSVLSVLLGVDRADISSQHWIYFPQKDLPFYRVGFPSNLSPQMCPPGTSSICAEIAFRGDPGASEEALIQQTVQGLQRVAILQPDDRLLVREVRRIPHAYVLYDRNYEANRSVVRDYLRGKHIFSIGRYGGWQYSCVEDALLEGHETARLVVRRMQAGLGVGPEAVGLP